MAQTQTVVLAPGEKTSLPARIDLSRFRSGVGLICTVDQGAVAKYTVQISADNIHWNDYANLTNKEASANDELQFPAVLLRLMGTVVNGQVTLGIVQAS